MANTPLVQAIMAAGGPRTWRASKSNGELVRINRNGSATRETFQLKLSEGASNTRNPPLQDGDTVIVNRTALAVAGDPPPGSAPGPRHQGGAQSLRHQRGSHRRGADRAV